MTTERVVEVEFLQDDLREIRAMMADPEPSDQDALSKLLTCGLESFQRDEASWRDFQARADSEPLKLELKRRETQALLISMRSRTIRSEIRMDELGTRVRYLEGLHAERWRESERLRRSISQLLKHIALVEESLSRGVPLLENEPPSLMARFIRVLRKTQWLKRS